MKADFSRLPRAVKTYIHELEERVTADVELIAERDTRIDELTKRSVQKDPRGAVNFTGDLLASSI